MSASQREPPDMAVLRDADAAHGVRPQPKIGTVKRIRGRRTDDERDVWPFVGYERHPLGNRRAASSGSADRS